MASVFYTLEDRIAFIDFESEHGNRISRGVRQDLHKAIERYKADEDAWIAVISSSGPDFCLGSETRPGASTAEHRALFELWGGGYHEIWKPTIAAVQGRCIGEGAALALSCDFRIGDLSTSLDFAFVGERSEPQVAAAWLLTLVGLSKAFELLWLGEVLTAQDALKLGLLSRIVHQGPTRELADRDGRLPMNPLQTSMAVEDGTARTAAKAFAKELLLNAPLTRRFQKEIAYRSIGVPFQYAQSLEIGKNPLGSADRIEGNRAFVENRRPIWRNE